MDLTLAMLILILSFVFLILGLILDREEGHVSAICLILAVCLFGFSGVAFHSITETGIACTSTAVDASDCFEVEKTITSYYPVGYLGYGLCMFSLLLVFLKLLSEYMEGETK